MPTSNISDSYIITNYAGSLTENRVRDPANDAASAAATGSVNIITSMAANLAGDTVTLINTVGLEKIYIFHNDSAGNTGTLDGSNRVRVQLNGLGPQNYNYSAQLKAAILSDNGHAGTINVVDLPEVNGFLALTQSVGGANGNRAIAATIGSGGFETGDEFKGGVTGTTAYKNADVIPYKLSIKGSFNLRGQTTTSRYRTFIGEDRT